MENKNLEAVVETAELMENIPDVEKAISKGGICAAVAAGVLLIGAATFAVKKLKKAKVEKKEIEEEYVDVTPDEEEEVDE